MLLALLGGTACCGQGHGEATRPSAHIILVDLWDVKGHETIGVSATGTWSYERRDPPQVLAKARGAGPDWIGLFAELNGLVDEIHRGCRCVVDEPTAAEEAQDADGLGCDFGYDCEVRLWTGAGRWFRSLEPTSDRDVGRLAEACRPWLVLARSEAAGIR
jgi:hypothetical protein